MSPPTISVVITAHNEGDELQRTLRSVVGNTRGLCEAIVVDDGSDDGSCDQLANKTVRVIRHAHRIGVAASRHEGSRAARGDVLCYLDGHQRLSKSCLDACAEIALGRGAIACPDVKDYGAFGLRAHGARFRLCPERGYFSAQWRQSFSFRRVTRVSGLRAPPYLIPRRLYSQVAWNPAARGWGGSEASVVVKSFFAGIPIVNISGPLARHRFQRRAVYGTSWDELYRNQAIIARVCFDDSTWFGHWLPRVFESHLSDEARAVVESPEVQAEHEQFLAAKVKTDRQFWTELARQKPPACVDRLGKRSPG